MTCSNAFALSSSLPFDNTTHSLPSFHYQLNGELEVHVSPKEKVTLILPSEMMDAVREEASPRGYSCIIAEAVTHYIEEYRRQALRKRLIAGYQATAERGQALAEDWRPLEEETRQEYIGPVEDQT